MKKRLVSILLVLAMVLMYSSTVMASEETTDSDNVFTNMDTTAYYYERFNNDAYRNVYDQLAASAEVFHNSSRNAEYYQESEDSYYYKAFTLTVNKKDWEVIGSEGVGMVIKAFLADNPTYFWLSTNFKYTAKSMDSGSICYVVTIICYNDYANGSAREVLKNNFDIIVSNYANMASEELPDYQKEYIIHNALIDDIYFNTEAENTRTGEDWANSIDGVFNSKHKSATSFGYAKAFKAIMDYLNIPCIYVEGNRESSDDNSSAATYNTHAWNMVCLDDGWYNVDLAYDDPETTSGKDVLIYDYFNVSSEKATKLVPNTDWLPGIPTCSGQAYSLANIQSQLEQGDIWQKDNYNFIDKMLDTYGLSVVLISVGLILILIVALIKHMGKSHAKKKKEKIKNTKTSVVDHSELDNELRRPPLS
jgi:hypothetical protein